MMAIDQILKAKLVDEFRRYDDNTVVELICDIVMDWTKQYDNKGVLRAVREIVVRFKMKMSELDWSSVEKKIECGNVHLQLEEHLEISKNIVMSCLCYQKIKQ
ncbi:MAG TPA: hypothetical protein VLX61_07360 [Anaerolineales bacterium]|nr:hypothetical protein [Anaerolineales bacterium]